MLLTRMTSWRRLELLVVGSPQNAVANGTMVKVANLPEAASIQVYFCALLGPNGLRANLTKDMLVNNPGQIFLTFVNTVFTSIKHGQIPMKDVFDDWMSEQIHKTYFYAMGKIAYKMLIGTEIATDTLKQRFHKLSHRRWNHVARKNNFLSVNEFFNKIVALTNEAKHLGPADVADQVPKLDAIFYQGLVPRLKEKAALAVLTQHQPSTNLGENLSWLQAIVDEAKEVEKEINQIVAILTSSNQFRCTPLVSSGASAASQNSHSYLATQALSADTQDALGSNSSMSTPARVNGNTVLLTHHHNMKDFGVQNKAAMTAVGTAMTPDWVRTLQQGTVFTTVPTKAVDNLVVLLSNAEQALCRSLGTNAPLRCWGCQGIHEDDQHLYQDCPWQLHENIQANFFQKKLDVYVAKKRAAEKKQQFDPNNWKKDSFASPKATSLFNGILDAANATSRQHLVAEFVYEHNSQSDVSVEQGIGRLLKHACINSPGGDEEEGGAPPLAFLGGTG
jgi:hypothetical protein